MLSKHKVDWLAIIGCVVAAITIIYVVMMVRMVLSVK